jgi:hypothetical protein
MNRIVQALCVVTAAAAICAASGAKTYPLKWRETLVLQSPQHGRIVMAVTRIVIAKGRWSVTGSIMNRTPYDVEIRLSDEQYAPSSMGLAAVLHPNSDPNSRSMVDAVHAKKIKPALPKALHPGDRWRGTFSGRKRLPAHRLVWVMFGIFHLEGQHAADLYWVTNHGVVTPRR